MSYPASSNQLSFVSSLVTERQRNVGVTDVPLFIETLKVERFTKTGASALIDHLLATPVDTVEVAAAEPGAFVRSGPVNRYGGKCVNCGGDVEAGAGTYRKAGSRWETLHCSGDPACGVKAAGTEYGDVVPSIENVTLTDIITTGRKDNVAWAVVTGALQEVNAGGFAVPSITGVNDLSFFRVKINKGTVNPSKKGQHYFATVVGGKGDGEVAVNPAYIAKAIQAIDSAVYTDPDTNVTYNGREAAERCYGNEIGQCGRCGKTLTSEYRKLGIGPECIKKGF